MHNCEDIVLSLRDCSCYAYNCCGSATLQMGNLPPGCSYIRGIIYNIALHFNPRFDYSGVTNTIVFNSLSGGCWGSEHREGCFPFVRGEECKFYINFNHEEFYIKLPDGSMVSFPNRLGDVRYNYFDVAGDARIVGIKIK
uniref:Galectin n=1 Tax=Mola mola TaxID=94237 RepID=A0A3Q3WC85_MOLML